MRMSAIIIKYNFQLIVINNKKAFNMILYPFQFVILAIK